jgi:membrane associated rhomboid family serine protease
VPSPARTEPARDLHQVLRWLAVLWLIEIADTVLSTILDPVDRQGNLVIHDGVLDMLGGLHPWDPQAPFWPQLLRLPVGMFGAPLLHAGWQHLIQNSLALGLLGYLSLRFSKRLTWAAIGYATICSTLLTWLIAPPQSVHVGVSGVIFGLVGFLLANGILRRGCLPILISLMVFLLYGGALIGMLPMAADERISWQMHLGGFLGGLAASWQMRKEKA